MRFPYSHRGTVSSEKSPISMPNTPNASAGPFPSTHSETKKVQAKAITARRMVTTTKQSGARRPYASISYGSLAVSAQP